MVYTEFIALLAGKVIQKNCRYYSEFNGSTSYAVLESPKNLINTFELVVCFLPTDTGGAYERAILGNSSTNAILSILSDARVKMIANNGYSFAAGAALLGQINKLIVQASGGNITVTLNDSVIRNEAFSDEFTFDWVGDAALPGNRSFNGFILNLNIKNGVEFDLPMNESQKEIDGTVNYIDRVSGLVGAVGYNINLVEICEGDEVI